jgi:hypothetical protein
MQRLLSPGAPGTRLFAESPFPEGPPPLARVALYRFTSTTLEEHKQTGCYWNVMPVGLHLAPTPLNEDVWKRWMPPPELFHSEAPGWRRRARFCRGIDQVQLSVFWDDFLPFVKATAMAISPADPYSWGVWRWC